mgnify:CR=1 FL=1
MTPANREDIFLSREEKLKNREEIVKDIKKDYFLLLSSGEEIKLNLSNKENKILYLLKQEPRTIEEIVLGHFVLKHPEIEDYASDILEYLMDNLRYEECFTYEENSLLLTITLEGKFFELCKELGIKTA